jgi:CheY-like chemotaxis protein
MQTPAIQSVTAEQLARLSHEFRTPLNGVLGMARLLDATDLTPEQASYVQALKESGDHLLGLVNDFLDLVRLGSGRIELHPAPVVMEDVLRQVCELMGSRADEKGISIAWAADPAVGTVLADEGRLRQILLNLIGNAIKFTDVGGVLVTADLDDSHQVLIRVRDTGPGIPEDMQTKVFEAFAQTTDGKDKGGAGLGLAIVAQLVDAMGGRCTVSNWSMGGADIGFSAPLEVLARGGSTSLAGRQIDIISEDITLLAAAQKQAAACGASVVTNGQADPSIPLIRLVDLAHAPQPLQPPVGLAIALISAEQRDQIDDLRKLGWAGYLIKPLRRASMELRIMAALGCDPGRARDKQSDERATDRAAEGLRVLLAEDNPINALLARTLLEREGCSVDRAASGLEVLQICATRDFDLILMDVRMPGLNGLETTRALRQANNFTPIVAVTADAFEEDRRQCLDAGMNDFLVKPLVPVAMRTVLTRAAGGDWTSLKQVAKLVG